MAERTLVPSDALLDVAEDVDDVIAAALGNTGLGAWLSLAWRAELQPGETVLVLGATGAAGSVAVQTAKTLGAGRVVAADRAGERLPRLLERGADAIVDLDSADDLAASFREPETADQVAIRIEAALEFIPADRLQVARDCGMKYLPRDAAAAKLRALVEGARRVRERLAAGSSTGQV